MAGKTPHGARPNRVASRTARSSHRVGRTSLRVIAGLEEWLLRGLSVVRRTGDDRTRLIGWLRHFSRRVPKDPPYGSCRPGPFGPGSLFAEIGVMAQYLVTGGAGFIGSHLSEELLRRGER